MEILSLTSKRFILYALTIVGIALAISFAFGGCATAKNGDAASPKILDWFSHAKVAETVTMPIGDHDIQTLVKGIRTTIKEEVVSAQEIQNLKQGFDGREVALLCLVTVLGCCACFVPYVLSSRTMRKRLFAMYETLLEAIQNARNNVDVKKQVRLESIERGTAHIIDHDLERRDYKKKKEDKLL